MKTREKEIEAWAREKFELQCEPPCDSYGVCQNCLQISDMQIGMEWADKNPKLSNEQIEFWKLCTKQLEAKLAIAVEALEYIGNSIPGANQEFEMENKRAAQSALAKIRGTK